MTETQDTPRTDDQMKDAIDALLRSVRHDRDAWEGAFATLRSYLEGELRQAARDLLRAAARRERLELQWKLEELLEETMSPEEKAKAARAKAKADAEADKAEGEEATGNVMTPLRPEDLVPIYDDPRGLMIHRHKTDGRWFLTQIDPQTGQPQTVELPEQHKVQVRQELAGSPYWLEKSWG